MICQIALEVALRSSNLFPLMAFLLVAGLFVSLFILPIGYTYDETCPRCLSKGTLTCETCHGSGICPVCGGDGKIVLGGWCSACNGGGKCYTCGGLGSYTCTQCWGRGFLTHWMYTALGSTVALSIINVFVFLGLFTLAYIGSSFSLSFNEWVYQVEDMGFWFNRSFMTWLFAKHPERWVKWQTAGNSILAIYLGVILFVMFSLKQVTGDSLVIGTLFGIMIVGLFSSLFYRTYTSRIEASP